MNGRRDTPGGISAATVAINGINFAEDWLSLSPKANYGQTLDQIHGASAHEKVESPREVDLVDVAARDRLEQLDRFQTLMGRDARRWGGESKRA